MRGDEPRRILEEPALHVLALARHVALAQRREDGDGAEHPPHHVVHGRARAQRLAHRARHVREPAHHLHDFVQRGALFVGPGEEALQRAIDEARIHFRQRRVPQAPGLERSGTEILEENIGRPDELLRRADPLLRSEIERDALLVAAEGREEAGARASAPRSASTSPAAGPITMCENSTTRMPSRGSGFFMRAPSRAINPGPRAKCRSLRCL